MTYRKDDVTFHTDGYGYGEGLPAVNVKTSPWDWDEHIGAAREEDSSLDPRFEEWYRENAERDGFLDSYWQFACDAGWEMLQMDAEFYFGDGVKVEAQGRSGGWAVVRGLPEFEEWDAIMLSKWRRFEKSARETADLIPSDMAILAAINGFEAWLATQPTILSMTLAGSGVGL